MVHFTRLSQKRWKEYRRLRLRALQAEPLAFGSTYEEELELNEQEWQVRMANALFALDRDRMVGVVVIIYHTKARTKHIANLYGFYVVPERRGQGLGRQLMEAAMEDIRNRGGVRKVMVWVNPGQEAAVSLYESFGFDRVGIVKEDLYYDGKYYDGLVMEKLLD